MTRALVIGNSRVLVNFDSVMNMRDFYYPNVGQLNHIGGHHNSFGIWVEDQFSWCYEGDWHRSLRYKKDTLVTDVKAENKRLGLQVVINDAVHYRDNLFLRKMVVKNLADREREVRVFFTHDFSIDESEVGDTALYNPNVDALYHFKRDKYFLANGRVGDRKIHQFTTGIKRFGGAEGTWRDAEDGILEGNPIAQGSVDSTISFKLTLEAKGEGTVYYWIAVGKNYQEIKDLNIFVLSRSPEVLLRRVEGYWRNWVNKVSPDFANLPSEIIDLYKRSLLITRTQINYNGAVIAANDSDILQFNRDHYCYMWPRDGALVVIPLIMAGYFEIATNFFSFCENSLTDEGFLLHKYNPDGTAGSSWHPWYLEGKPVLPIQEDETALVLYSLWHYYQKNPDLEMIQRLYRSLIRPSGDFMVNYMISELGLPDESHDLWEERRGIFTFTAASVYAGLRAAAYFASLLTDEERAEIYAMTADNIKKGILEHLYDDSLNRFLRGIYIQKEGYKKDPTLESSIFAIFAFGVLPASDPRVEATMKQTELGLWVKTQVGGAARYTNDYYFQKSHDLERVPGNPWIICTLWLALWHIERAITLDELKKPLEIIKWVQQKAMSSGILSEQLHPYSGEPVSVAPLTWSHATFVHVVVAYTEKYQELLVSSRVSPEWE